MITLPGNRQLEDIAALRHLVMALERWFPDHNGPFEYGTRLAEESGELAEALRDLDNDPLKHHLTKEVRDMLVVVVGIAVLYGVDGDFPQELAAFRSPPAATDIIPLLAIRVGELASAINHAEGMGVKRAKHGDNTQILVKARGIIELIAWIIQLHDLRKDLKTRIVEDYLGYKQRGLID